MVLDDNTQKFYMIGKIIDQRTWRNQNQENEQEMQMEQFKSDFWSYDTKTGQWKLISQDTQSQNGPMLISDFSMDIDQQFQVIYIFGGNVNNANGDSELYKYLIN